MRELALMVLLATATAASITVESQTPQSAGAARYSVARTPTLNIRRSSDAQTPVIGLLLASGSRRISGS